MKLIIPTILAATILIAGAFAFLPVQEAVTLHLSGTEASQGANTVDSAAIVDETIVSADIDDGSIANADLADDTIDFTKIADALTLDAATTITGNTLAFEAAGGNDEAVISGILEGAITNGGDGDNDITVNGIAPGDVAYCSVSDSTDAAAEITQIGVITSNTVNDVTLANADVGAAGDSRIDCVVFDLTP